MAPEPPSPTICYDAKIQPETNMEPSWNNTSVLLGNDVQIFPELLRARENSAQECMGLFTDFKNMQQTKLQARHLVQGDITVHFFLLSITNTINLGIKMN